MKTVVLKSLSILLGSVALLLLIAYGYEQSIAYQIDLKPFRFLTLKQIFLSPLTGENDSSKVETLPFPEAEPAPPIPDSSLVSQDTTPSIEDVPYVSGEILAEDTLHNEFYLYNPKRQSRALDAFFKELEQLERSKSGNLRIAHYGDSQLEGGLITYDIRELLKQKFKGGGTGFIPFYEPCYHLYVSRKLIGDWRRYTCFHNRYTNGYYGFGGTVFRFMPARNASFQPNLNQPEQIAKCIITLQRPLLYHQLKLFWGKAKTPWTFKVYVKDSLAYEAHYDASEDFNVTVVPLKNSPKNLVLEFQAVESPDLYGFSLDTEKGLYVDNLALRGHSGNGLHILNTQFLKSQYDTLHHKLILLQYGGNIIPYTNVKNFKWYEEDLYRILLKLKRALPNASILVISTMDMGFKNEQGIHSYPTVPKVRDAQKRASLRAGVAFLDLYELMGGKHAIKTWFQQGLALNDYAHLTPKGQRKIAELIVSALLNEYETYKQNIQLSSSHPQTSN